MNERVFPQSHSTISFSVCLLLAYKEATTDPLKLILYPVILLRVLIKKFQVELLGSLMYIIPSTNRDHLTFPICIPLISFSCLIALASTSSILLKMSRIVAAPSCSQLNGLL